MFEFHFFKTNHSLQKRLVYLLFILAIFFLLWNFGQDPSNLKSLSDFFDEGFWTQNAISKVRYGNYFTDSNSQAYFGAISAFRVRLPATKSVNQIRALATCATVLVRRGRICASHRGISFFRNDIIRLRQYP